VDSRHIKETVNINGKKIDVLPTSQLDFEDIYYQKEPIKIPEIKEGEMSQIYFGEIYGTRSGDKGGCANLGVWAKDLSSYAFLYEFLTVENLKELLPDLKNFKIDRYELANIYSLNFYIEDILQDGVSSNNKIDSQAKSLGEYLRAKLIQVPSSILNGKNYEQ
jgi:hypothetical protein